ncbi:MAG: DNA repair protein RecO C-terminal domain-containing protein [Bacteroidaceae bacterium]|nr:DNA repair protein RecO C-terminal domain-containing protein [Bacteroidaceae bacterium]
MQKTEAIVIYSFPFKDRKYMLELFTREHGKMTFVTNRRLQPLTIIEIVFDEHKQKLSAIDIALAYKTILYNPVKLSISFFIAEFLRYATRNEPTNLPLYDYLRQALMWFDVVEDSFANFHLVLMMRLSAFLGFAPDTDNFHAGDFFDLREAQFTTLQPMHPDHLSSAEAASIVTLMRMNFASMHLFKLNKDQRNHIADHIIQYYRLHIPGFQEMKSLQVLRELFD